MRKPPIALGLAALLMAAAAPVASAQIKKLDLDEMVEIMDGAVYGEIVATHCFRIDTPEEPELYFTTITIEGRSMVDGSAVTVDVTFDGGFISPDAGVHNSEAPPADDIKVGNRIITFYAWRDNIGAGRGANLMIAGHGGVFRTAEGPKGSTVLGRGKGFAIEFNTKVADLDSAVRKIRKLKLEEKGK